MGCDIHIVIQRQDETGAWQNVQWQAAPWNENQKLLSGVPVAPDVFDSRNYDLFGILADVRNGRGFAGIQMGEGWPSIAPERGLPEGFSENAIAPDPQYPEEGPKYLGDHSFTWVSLDELKAFPWDTSESWLYGCVPADEYERLSADGKGPTSYSGGVSGLGIHVYEPDAYKKAKAMKVLPERPYVRMGWPETAREATNDWPGKVLPWLDTLAAGRPLRLVLGFDS